MYSWWPREQYYVAVANCPLTSLVADTPSNMAAVWIRLMGQEGSRALWIVFLWVALVRIGCLKGSVTGVPVRCPVVRVAGTGWTRLHDSETSNKKRKKKNSFGCSWVQAGTLEAMRAMWSCGWGLSRAHTITRLSTSHSHRLLTTIRS